MSKIKRFFDCFVPVFSCNLKCSYCYVTQHTVRKEGEVFHYSAEEVYSALSQDRLGGICCFNLCGDGETLYPADIIPIIHSILKRGHFVNIITNGTMTDRFKEILKFPESCRDRLFVKFSYHYLELHTHRLTEIFFRNFNMLRKSSGTTNMFPISKRSRRKRWNTRELCRMFPSRGKNTESFRLHRTIPCRNLNDDGQGSNPGCLPSK